MSLPVYAALRPGGPLNKRILPYILILRNDMCQVITLTSVKYPASYLSAITKPFVYLVLGYI